MAASRSASRVMGLLGTALFVLLTGVSVFGFLAGQGLNLVGPAFGIAALAYLYLIPRSVSITVTNARMDYRAFDGLRWRRGSIAAKSVTGFRILYVLPGSSSPTAAEVSDADSAAAHKILLGSLDARDCDLVLAWLGAAQQHRERSLTARAAAS